MGLGAANSRAAPGSPHSSYATGHNEWGHNSLGAESLWGRHKVPTMSQILSSVQYICFRKTSGSNMGPPNLLLGPGAI